MIGPDRITGEQRQIGGGTQMIMLMPAPDGNEALDGANPRRNLILA